MTLTSLRILTWGTVASAVMGALLLAAIESGRIDFNPQRTGVPKPLPSEPTGAVPQTPTPASAPLAH